jgi:hypothetical protein
MAKYEVEAPDGKTVTLEGPEGASEADIIAQAKRLYVPKDATAKKTFTGPMGGLNAFMRGAARGASFNFADEIAAGLDTVLPLDKLTNPNIKSIWDGLSLREAFDANMREQARQDKAADVEHPIASGTGKVAGAVAGTLAGGRALGLGAKAGARGVPALARATSGVRAVGPSAAVVPGAAAAGLAGAVSGFGEGDTLPSRVQGAKTGGYVGTVIGAPVAASISGLAPIVAKYAKAFAGKGVTQQALVQIQRALARSGYDVTSPEGAAALRTELAKYGSKPVTLADVGHAIRERTGIGLRSTSDAQSASIDQVLERQAGAPARLERDIRATVAPRTDVHALDDAIVEQRAATALPLKAEALRTPVDQNAPVTPDEVQRWIDKPEVKAWLEAGGEGPTPGALVRAPSTPVIPNDEVLQNLAKLPQAKAALRGAKELADNERQLLQVQGKDTSHLPDFPAEDAPLDMKALDYVKRYLDGEVSRAFSSSDSATRAKAPGLRDLRDAIRDRMRAAVPKYGDYLDTYGDASEMREALAAGRGGEVPGQRGHYQGFDRTDPEVIAAEQADRSEAAQEMYRVGAARNLLDKIRNATDNSLPADRLLNSPEARARLTATGIPPEADAQLNQAVQQERTLSKLTGMLKGSQADARAAARRDAESLDGTTPFNPASKASWLAFFARHVAGNVDLRRNAKINEAVLPRVLATDPKIIDRVIKELTLAGRANEAAILARAQLARRTAGSFGAVIGAPVTEREGR